MTDLCSGLSGCAITRLPNGCIQKKSVSIDYNERFRRQIAKQSAFNKLTFRHLCAPSVIFSNLEDGLVTCEMTYCSGLSYDQYLSTASHKQIDEVIAALFEYFDYLVADCKFYSQNAAFDLIKSKLVSLAPRSKHDKLIHFLIGNAATAKGSIPHTFCHGDLTLSNIIFHPKKLHFIDFLDSFVDSYLVDLVKLKQDLIYNWSAMTQNKDSLRLAQVRAEIWKSLEDRYCQDVDSDYFRILEVMNFLRIEPYVKDSRVIAFLNSILTSF